MMDGGERLYQLLLALFRSDAELRRFLALHGFTAPRATRSEGSFRSAALAVARTLDENGQINQALFDALEERSPDRRGDIREVARFYGVGTAPPSSPGGGTVLLGADVPPELAGFAQQLRADLDAVQVPDDTDRAMDPGHWPWTAVAAVLGGFLPTDLHPLPGTYPPDSALRSLADFIFASFDGSWVLRQEFRIPALRRLLERGRLEAALDANRDIDDLHRDLLDTLVFGRRQPSLTRLDTRRLEALGMVADWLEPLPANFHVNRTAIAAATERRQLLDPLRALAGTHFRGRAEELKTIRRHIRGRSSERVLCIQGTGGIGKSSLMGKVLLDLEDQAAARSPVSFAYIDFDRARHDPHDPLGLVEQIARQLRLLYATAGESEKFAAVESLGARTDLNYAAQILEISRFPTVTETVDALADRLRQVRDLYSPGAVSLVLALDTFEEVQVKGPGATHVVLALIEQLQRALPDMRVIISGRGVIREFERDPSARVRWLGDLDDSAADGLLADLGVADPALRRQIAEQFGRNPLTLHLAARALADSGADEVPFNEVVAEADALAKVSVELVQGILYRRILGHIADPDVVKVAYPGLAVRRVTVAVLREVLAQPCGFDPDHSEAIFERLQTEVAMFDLEDRDTLRHRQDVRRLMLRIMREDPRQAPVVSQIHQRAAVFYASRGDLNARAEQIYHRLMTGEDPRQLGRLWEPRLNPLLASAIEEPLPPRARSWLGRRLGLGPVSGDQRDEWGQEDWEDDAASRASSWLSSNLPAKCLEVLSERPERLEGSRLYALEVTARTALGELDQAGYALEHGLRGAIDVGDHKAQLELLEAAVGLRSRQADAAGVVEAARSAAALTDVTGEPARALWALTGALAALQAMGLTPEVPALTAEISRRFGRLPRSDMRGQPELVRRVLHTAGVTDSAVLAHAALEVGDEGAEKDAVFIQDSFALGRLLDQTRSSARPELEELAREVGMTAASWTNADLATRIVRYGRTGKAIALGLTYARDENAARQLVLGELVRPYSQEWR
jgi:hypothetical protein